MRKLRPSFFPAISWFIISTILLTLPGSVLPEENWLDRIGFDKWVHIAMFFIMVTLWCWAMTSKYKDPKKLKNMFWGIALMWVGYGIGMEFVQRYCIPNRSFDPDDIVADAAGCALGLLFSWKRYIKK